MFSVRNLGEYLAGDWHLERSIVDRRQSIHGDLAGMATFTRIPEGLDFIEEGTFRFGAHAGPASRRYKYVLLSDTDAEIRFTDETHFCHVNLSTGVCRATHLCGRDTYVGTFTARSATSLDVEWQVSGPRKDATIRSHYRR